MKKTFALLAIILLIACNDNTVEINTETPINSENASFFEEKEDKTSINNIFYKSFLYEENELVKNEVLKITQQEIVPKNTLFSSSIMQIQSAKNNWKATVNAHELSIKNNTLEAKYNSDYEHEDTYSLYNIETGEHLLNYSYNCLTARIPESNFKRYIGFTARSNASNLLAEMDNDVLGILTYASDKNTIQKFVIKTLQQINTNTPSMELVALDENQELYQSNRLLYFMNLEDKHSEKDINFAFGFTFYQGEMATETAMLFEVKEDEISLKDAKYDTEVFEIEAF